MKFGPSFPIRINILHSKKKNIFMVVFLKADFGVCYLVPLGFVVLMRSFVLVEHLGGASQDEKSGCEAGELHLIDLLSNVWISLTPCFGLRSPLISYP